MYKRYLKIVPSKSFFLFGPRGTGKTTWIKQHFSDSIYIDLLEEDTYASLFAYPSRINDFIPPNFDGWVIIDEIQRVPRLLNEVHRLIELTSIKFAMTGSSARSLRKKGVNLLAGRALSFHMHALTALELGADFDISKALRYGLLPSVIKEDNPQLFLRSYVQTYLKEEVLQEGLTRNLEAFSRFLEVASFSQGQVLNISLVGREASIHRKVVESYFQILEDLLLARKIPIFSKRAKRKVIQHPKFYFFDIGVYRIVRPRGPLDTDQEIDGAALETLFLQNFLAINDYFELEYSFYYWRTTTGLEVDFILYGPNGLKAIEIKRASQIHSKDLKGLKEFKKDYPEAELYLLYQGNKKLYIDSVKIIPMQEVLKNPVPFLKKIQT